MFNFLGFVKEQKRATWLILLFFIVIGFVFPNTTSADIFGIDGVPGKIIVWLADAWYWIFWGLAKIAYELFLSILGTLISSLKNSDTWNITSNQVFLGSWSIVKDWANILIVLGIIGIAIMMILRLWADNAKKALIGMIIVALLVNFSGVFCGLLIDASNIVMLSLNGDQEDMVKKIDEIKGKIKNNYTTQYKDEFYTNLEGIMSYVAVLAVFDFMFIILTVAYAYFSVMIIQRYILLAILFILSPLAFVFFVFPIPAAKNLWDEWWRNFIKWCFIGIGAMFFLKLASSMLLVWHDRFAWEGTDVVASNIIVKMMPMILRLLVVMGILLIGLKIAKKGGGPVADFTMGLAKKGIGIVAGTAAAVMTGGAMAGLRASGIAGIAQNTKERVGDFGTRLLARRGTADLKKQQRLKKQIGESKSEDRMDAIGSEKRLNTANQFKYNKYLPFDPKKREEIAGLTKSLLKNGDFDKLSPAKQKELIEFNKNVIPGVIPMKEFAKVNPDYARQDPEAINEAKRSLINTTSPTGHVYTEADLDKKSAHFADMQINAKKMAVRKALAAMKIKNLENMSAIDVAREAREKTAKGTKYLQEATKRNILGMVGTKNEVGSLLKYDKEEYGSDTLRNARKINPKYVEFDEEAIDKEITGSGITPGMPMATRRNNAITRLRIADYKGMGPREIKEMEDDAFTLEFIEATSARKITKAGELGLSATKKKKLKDFLPTIKAAIAVAAPGGANPDTKRHRALTDKYEAIDML